MDNYIKWESCDKWNGIHNPVTKQTELYHLTRELICSHPAVDRLWFHGSLSENQGKPPRAIVELHFAMILSDGRRFDVRNIAVGCFDSGKVPEAEEYLQSLSNENLS
jgi:hypothetical protein